MIRTTARRAAIAGAGIAALATALAPTAVAQPSNAPTDINTVLAIEGKGATMLMPMWVGVPRTGTTTLRDSSGQRVRVSARSVLAQAVKGTTTAKVPMKWAWYASFGAPWITSIGGQGAKGASGWNFRVNGLYLARAANKVNLGFGDRVTWYWGKEFVTVLDITTPGVGSIPGAVTGPGPFTVTVTQVTAKNVRTPAAGATVTYGSSTATTGADGTVVFAAQPGVGRIRATKAGLIASTRAVCTLGTDPACPAG